MQFELPLEPQWSTAAATPSLKSFVICAKFQKHLYIVCFAQHKLYSGLQKCVVGSHDCLLFAALTTLWINQLPMSRLYVAQPAVNQCLFFVCTPNAMYYYLANHKTQNAMYYYVCLLLLTDVVNTVRVTCEVAKMCCLIRKPCLVSSRLLTLWLCSFVCSTWRRKYFAKISARESFLSASFTRYERTFVFVLVITLCQCWTSFLNVEQFS